MPNSLLKTYSMQIDFMDYQKNRDREPVIVYNEGDMNTAFVEAELTMNGVVIDLTDATVTMGVRNSERKHFINSCTITDAKLGRISIPFTMSTLSKIGFCRFEITIRKNNQKVTSPSFVYRVSDSIIDNQATVDSESYDVLLVLISQVQEAIDKVNLLNKDIETQEAQRQANEKIREQQEEQRVEAEKLRHQEVIQARESLDGTTHNTLSDRLKYDLDMKADKSDTYTKQEVDNLVAQGGGGNANIDDAVTSLTTTWSSTKITEEIKSSIESIKGNNSYDRTIQIGEWNQQSDGSYLVTVTHNLNSKKIFVTAIDNTTQEAIMLPYKIIDDNTIQLNLLTPIELFVSIINGELIIGGTGGGVGGVDIDDTIITTSKTWSSNKINSELSNKVDKNDIYTKTEVNDELDKKADKSDTYTKDEVNNLIQQIGGSGGGNANIDDNTTSSNTTWSSQKITDEIKNSIDNIKTDSSFSESIPTASWLQQGATYSKTITHNLGTEKIVVVAIDANTKESVMVHYKIVDSNSVEISLTTSIDLTVHIINGELQVQGGTGTTGGTTIDDSVTVTDKTWSSSKIQSELDKKPTDAKSMVFDNTTNGFTATNVQSAIEENKISITTLNTEVDNLKQSVSDGKTLIASAITDKKVPTSNTDTFQVMADNISKIPSGGIEVLIDGVKADFDFELVKSSSVAQWGARSTLPVPFHWQTRMILHDNQPHALGGANSSRAHYKFNGLRWEAVSTLPMGVYVETVVQSYNGEIHILNYQEHYSFNGSTWTKMTNIPLSDIGMAPSCVLDRKMHVIAQVTYDSSVHYTYNAASDSWTQVATINASLEGGVAVTVNSDIYVVNIYNSTSVWRYSSGSWQVVSTMPHDGASTVAFNINDEIHMIGGADTPTVHRKYSPNASSKWTTITTNLPYSFYSVTGVSSGEEMHLIGARNYNDKHISSHVNQYSLVPK